MDAFWLPGNLSRAPTQEGGGTDEVAGTCCREVKGDGTLFPFLQNNLLSSVYFTGPCQRRAENGTLQHERGSPPVPGSVGGNGIGSQHSLARMVFPKGSLLQHRLAGHVEAVGYEGAGMETMPS